MHFAFCLFKFFPFGGLERDFLRIAQTCLARGHRIDVYTSHWEGQPEPGLTVKLISARGWQNHSAKLDYIRKVTKAMRKKSYDAVVGFNKMPGLDIYYAADICFQARVSQTSHPWYRWLPRYRCYQK